MIIASGHGSTVSGTPADLMNDLTHILIHLRQVLEPTLGEKIVREMIAHAGEIAYMEESERRKISDEERG